MELHKKVSVEFSGFMWRNRIPTLKNTFRSEVLVASDKRSSRNLTFGNVLAQRLTKRSRDMSRGQDDMLRQGRASSFIIREKFSLLKLQLHVTDIETMMTALRLAWIPRLLQNGQSNWKFARDIFVKTYGLTTSISFDMRLSREEVWKYAPNLLFPAFSRLSAQLFLGENFLFFTITKLFLRVLFQVTSWQTQSRYQ